VHALAERVQARGPGRVNLIGEHTDYNDGLALPFAIERGVTVTAEPADGTDIEIRALDLGEEDAFALAGREPVSGWRAFARGMVAELRAAGYELRPARLTVEGDLEQGSGLSSSAALETALALALLAVAGQEPPADRRELARLCSRVENDWVGAETGLLGDWALGTLDSGAAHSHAESGYNDRRRECREAAAELGIASLREAASADGLPEPLAARVRHVVSENARVDAMVAALYARDFEAAARLLDASHASLRDDYAASVPAVERTVERLKTAGAAGARMVGGGFGGAVLGLLAPGVAVPAGALPVTPGPPAALV
jgi:galactokinase